MNLIDELYTDDPTSGQRKLRAAVRPKPFLSAPGEMNRKFPYLTAVIDRYSRRILSRRLSTTLSANFCEEAVREAIDRYGSRSSTRTRAANTRRDSSPASSTGKAARPA